jgi:hypothetical protein
MVFQFYLKNSNSLRLVPFFNSKLETQNSKPCLNEVFVQALTAQVYSSRVHGSTVEGRESSNISRNLGRDDFSRPYRVGINPVAWAVLM